MELGYTISLVKRKTFNFSIEPVLGIGRATASFNIFKSDRNAQSLDLALIARKKIGKVVVGYGWISGFTNINRDYLYWGYLGLTARLGFQIHPNFLIEGKGNLQMADMESKAVAGLSLIWLK